MAEIASRVTNDLSLPLLAGVALGLIAIHKARGPVSAWFARLPGLLAHELAHFFVAFFTRSEPSAVSLFPKRIPEGWELGSVGFSPGLVTAGFVALAPLYLLPPIAFLLLNEFAKEAAVARMLAGYTIATLLWSAWPSSQDWRIALRYPLGTFILAAILALWLHLTSWG